MALGLALRDTKEALAAIRTESDSLRTILNGQNRALSLVNGTGQLVWSNSTFAHLCGDSPECLRHILSVLPVVQQDQPKIPQALTLARLLGHFETKIRVLPSFATAAQPAEPHTYQLQCTATRDRAGNQVILSFSDVSNDGELASQLLTEQRIDTLGRVAGSLTHDLNNRLSVIRSGAELVSLALPQGHESQPDLLAISEATNDATALTSEILTLSRPLACSNGLTSVTAALEQLKPHLRRIADRQATLDLSLSPQELAVKMSALDLQQVVLQLATNAVEAVDRGGRIRIAVSAATDSTVRLLVEDNGHGIAPDITKRVFEPFFTTKKTATNRGLGLSTVQAVVERAQGRVDILRSDPSGTTVCVELPKAKEAKMTPTNEAYRDDRTTPQLLVLDDEEPVRRLLVRLLGREGYIISEASNLDEALTKARALDRLDVWVTDANVNGVDATTAIATMRQRHPSLAIVLVSGAEPDSKHMAQLTADGVRYLAKPFTPADLRKAIEEAYQQVSATSVVVPLGGDQPAFADSQAR